MRLKKYIDEIQYVFKTRTHNKHQTAFHYIKGLFQARKGNMERMVERVVDSEYFCMQHFISESPWDARAGFDAVARDVNEIFESFDQVALLIDESAHSKKGECSVGVARQYCGNTGKVDNCQVAVYGALSAEKYYGLIDTALYLPKSWTESPERCVASRVPQENRAYKTKIELAFDMVSHQVELGTRFDYVGADGLYGNSYWFQDELNKLGLLFVLDIHRDQHVYTKRPRIYLPEKKGSRGRNPSRYKVEEKAVKVEDLRPKDNSPKWKQIRLRKTGKGDLVCWGYVRKVYIWDGESSSYAARKLIFRATETDSGKLENKYAISNSKDNKHGTEELVRMLSQRYFVERSFQDAKQEAGMSDYQVRGWMAWHHHMALVMMAQQYMLSEKIRYNEEYPLLSAYDIKEIIMMTYATKGSNIDVVIAQMQYRHKQRAIRDVGGGSS
jgi:SRSO17 transposase